MVAARAVMDVVDGGRSLDVALATHRAKVPQRRRAWLQEIANGACRHYHYFDRILAQLLSKPLKSRDRVLHFILINGCYQLEHMRTPHYAVVSESVAAVAGGRFEWSGNMINGVLRNFLAQHERLKRELAPSEQSDEKRHEKNTAAWFSFPPWLYREIRTHWPDHFRQIMQASNRKPPLTVRVNQRKISRDAYLERLAASGMEATPTADSELGVTLASAMPVEKIPGFADGLVSVQDESAQLVARALSLPPGERVLDGCAAPGGKTCLLLECQPKLAMVAVDLPPRINRLAQNLARLGLVNEGSEGEVEVVAADLTQPKTWWDGRLFARILLDVPCSGSGIIRRHPDIKHRRRADDVAKFAGRQFDLLSAVWSLLEQGGTLLYVTCSILPAENDAVIKKWLAAPNQVKGHAKAQSLNAVLGIATDFGRQRLPGVHPGDGFYFCRLKKIGNKY